MPLKIKTSEPVANAKDLGMQALKERNWLEAVDHLHRALDHNPTVCVLLGIPGRPGRYLVALSHCSRISQTLTGIWRYFWLVKAGQWKLLKLLVKPLNLLLNVPLTFRS
ncbi:MAG: hypothetical protein ACPL7O_06880 [Armatimonadota bacterium]